MVRRRLQDAAAALRRAEHAAEQAENVLSDRMQADLPAATGGVASIQRLAGFREDARRKLREARRKIEVLSAREEETRRELVLRRQEEESDRKSTRLNSSHVAISYAVFCLKKKNNINKRSSQ